jgi:hypothetical protein
MRQRSAGDQSRKGGIHRCMLHLWIQDDTAFAAADHEWQIEVRERALT